MQSLQIHSSKTTVSSSPLFSCNRCHIRVSRETNIFNSPESLVRQEHLSDRDILEFQVDPTQSTTHTEHKLTVY